VHQSGRAGQPEPSVDGLSRNRSTARELSRP
jgi:hypothetical protein